MQQDPKKKSRTSWTTQSLVICNFFAFLCLQKTAFCSDWAVDASGNYSNAANWTAGVPNAVDAVANFPNIITSNRTITLDISPTVGTVSLHTGPFSYAITPSPVNNFLDMQGASPSISLEGAGFANINAAINVNTSLNIASGLQLFITRGITGTGDVNFNGTGTVIFQTTGCTYVGATNISSGTIAAVVANTFPTNTAMTLTGGVWNLFGNQSVGSIAGTGGTIALGSAPGTFLQTGSDNTNTTFAGVISGTGMTLRKTGTGIFTLSGTNTYSTGTTVLAGTLSISTDRNLGAIPGSPTTNVTLSGSTFQSTGTFSLSANRNISLTSTSFFDVTGSNIWTIPSVISGAGGLTKTNTGTLILSGTNTYAGVTTVNGGTLAITNDSNLGAGASALILNAGTTLQANGASSLSSHPITLGGAATINTNGNAFNISTVISGTGPLTKSGDGTLSLNEANTYTLATTVSAGQLNVNGSIDGTLVSVLSGAVLSGTGTINAPIDNSGTIFPGNVTGTLTVTDAVTFQSGSTYHVDITPTDSGLLDVVGANVTIMPGTTLLVSPQPGVYPMIGENFYTIIQTTNNVIGTFSAITNPLPLFQTRVAYFSSSVQLIISISPFTNHVSPTGNIGAVALCLENVAPAPNTDIDNIITQLIFIQDASLLGEIFYQMQPSIFTGFALSQEDVSIAIRSAMSKRADILNQNGCLRNAMQRKQGWTLWGDALGNFSHQDKQSNEKGFNTWSGGTVVGADYQTVHNFFLGLSGAYSYTNINWQQQIAEGNVQTAYASLYGTYSSQHFFMNAVVSGAYNSYFGQRNIQFLAVDRRARNNHIGYEGLAYLSMGGLFQSDKGCSFNPFVSADYVYLHQNAFKEHGADSLNLRVESNNSEYLRGEAGFNFNRCVNKEWGKLVPNVKFSVIREWRFQGKHYETEITGAGCTFTVTGLSPDRTLYAPGASLTALLRQERLALSIAYDGEFSKFYWNQNANFQLSYSF